MCDRERERETAQVLILHKLGWVLGMGIIATHLLINAEFVGSSKLSGLMLWVRFIFSYKHDILSYSFIRLMLSIIYIPNLIAFAQIVLKI